MKGLLLKEWYLARKNCAILIFNEVLFLAVGLLSKQYFFLTLAAFMAGIIPVSLISLDDQSKWTAYSNILPYSRAQLVSVKYIVMLITTVAATAFVAAGTYIGFAMGNISLYVFIMICAVTPVAATFSPCILLPLIFKLGIEKGRMAYYVVIFGVWTVLGGATAGYKEAASGTMAVSAGIIGAAALGLVICSLIILGVSWLLSIRVYEKREF